MTTFVLVHGGWAGGWQWREVAALLEAAGHVALRPTLTGLGERVHIAKADIDLDLHVQDILNVYRRIGRATDRLVTTDAIRRALLIVLALLLFALEMGVQLADLPGR